MVLHLHSFDSQYRGTTDENTSAVMNHDVEQHKLFLCVKKQQFRLTEGW